MTTAATAAAPWPPERRGWFVVAVLCACVIVSFIDRQIINLLVEDLRRDLQLTDTSISLLQGLAFALFYAACGLPLGRMADHRNRKWMIASGLAVWTLATALCGTAAGFAQLFLWRMLVGIGEATLTPCAFSMMADLFKPQRLALPAGLYTGASFIGSGIALVAGGAILSHLAKSGPPVLPLLGEVRLWQAAFIIAAAPGVLVLLVLVLMVREPARRGVPMGRPVERPPLREVFAVYRAKARAFNAVFIGVSLLGAVQFAIGAWGPAFLMRVHGWTPGQVGAAYGLVLILCGTSGAIVGGWLAVRMEGRGGQGQLRTAQLSALATLPFALAFPLAPSGTAALMLLAPTVFLGSLALGVGPALTAVLAPPGMRGALIAVNFFASGLIGQAIGPWLVALSTDRLFGAPVHVRYSLVLVPGVLLLLALVFIRIGLGALRKDASSSAPAGVRTV